MFTKLRDTSKREHVFLAIRAAMANGALAPGQRLVEADLARQMNVGTPTIREALIDLEHLGFVTRVPSRGTFVTQLTEEEATQIYRVREVLEGFALRLARQQQSKSGLATVRERLESMRKAALAVDRNAFYEADISFHRAIWDLSRNKYLVKTLEILVAPLFADIVTRYPADKESLVEVVGWHEKMVNCVTVTQENDGEVEETIRDVLAAFQRYDRRMYNNVNNNAESPSAWPETSLEENPALLGLAGKDG